MESRRWFQNFNVGRALTLKPGSLRYRYAVALMRGGEPNKVQEKLGVTPCQAKYWSFKWRRAARRVLREETNLTGALFVLAKHNQINPEIPEVLVVPPMREATRIVTRKYDFFGNIVSEKIKMGKSSAEDSFRDESVRWMEEG